VNGPVHVVHLPTEAEAYPYNGTNDAVIADWGGDLAYLDAGRVVLRTKQGDMSPEPTDVVILDRTHADRRQHEIYPIKRARYDTNWAPMGERS
jgi:hypothetical protein